MGGRAGDKIRAGCLRVGEWPVAVNKGVAGSVTIVVEGAIVTVELGPLLRTIGADTLLVKIGTDESAGADGIDNSVAGSSEVVTPEVSPENGKKVWRGRSREGRERERERERKRERRRERTNDGREKDFILML